MPNLNITIFYSFAFNGLLVESLYEFQFNMPQSGQIVLAKGLNRSFGEIREVKKIINGRFFFYKRMKFQVFVILKLTLAATARRPNDQKTITSYQYLCIKILPSYDSEPCFRRTPV